MDRKKAGKDKDKERESARDKGKSKVVISTEGFKRKETLEIGQEKQSEARKVRS